MTPELTTLLAIGAGGLLLLVGGVYWWVNRTPNIERQENEPLPLFGGISHEQRISQPAALRPDGAVRPPAPAVAHRAPSAPLPAPKDAPESQAKRPPAIREFVSGVASPIASTQVTLPPVPGPITPPSASPPAQPVMSDAGVPGTMVEGHALRFSVPAEGTLQFLPGRLEIGSGFDAGREIRFVRVEGPNGIEVTFGRSEGELYRHIQLRDRTVSRAHAVLRFTDGEWLLQNLSSTNPVIYNGAQMPAGVGQPLNDGDRIEMGEVVFTFRSR